jgi:hypothetical protein
MSKRSVIYTDVPEHVVLWVEAQASRLMISKAAVVRQILVSELRKEHRDVALQGCDQEPQPPITQSQAA